MISLPPLPETNKWSTFILGEEETGLCKLFRNSPGLIKTKGNCESSLETSMLDFIPSIAQLGNACDWFEWLADQWAQWRSGITSRGWFAGEAEASGPGFPKIITLQQKENGWVEGKKLSGHFAVASSATIHGSLWKFQRVRVSTNLERPWSKLLYSNLCPKHGWGWRMTKKTDDSLIVHLLSCSVHILSWESVELVKALLHYRQTHFSLWLFSSPYSHTSSCHYSFLDSLQPTS